MKLKLAFSLPLLIIFSYAKSQTAAADIIKMQFQAKQVISPGPEAAELGKYGNVPISLFTGTPNISIPLTELKGNSLSLPISLSYNASGFKSEDIAPWVGSGWSLNAGGVITRSVQGNPDVATNYFSSDTAINAPSNYWLFDYYDYMHHVQDGTIEPQADIYYYNFAGHSGKFVLKPNQTVVNKEKDFTKITACVTCDNASFTIIDDQGIKYIFDSVEITHSVPSDEMGQSAYVTYDYPSAWYLTKIISADGIDVITLDYYATSSQTLYQNMQANASVSLEYKSCSETYTVAGCPQYIPCQINSSSTGHSAMPPEVSIKRKFLKKITLTMADSTVSYIDFLSTAGVREDSDFGEDRFLNKAKLFSRSNNTDKLIKQYNFGYGYFVNNDNTFYKKRLRLDTLLELGSDSGTTIKPPYLFTYNTSTSIPERFTKSLDHWGFFNASNNTTLVPSVPTPYGVGTINTAFATFGLGSNRDPSLDGSQATLLNKIQYPTGGYTTFEYELNDAKNSYDNTIAVGGVRITQLVDYSFTDKKAIVKNYSYLLDDNTSSGITGFPPQYTSLSYYHHYFTPHFGLSCSDEEFENTTFTVSSNSLYGLGTFQGSHIGYSQVTESQTDLVTGESLGKTVYKYNIATPSERDDDLSNGDLLEQEVYDNAGKLLEEKKNTYAVGYYPGGGLSSYIVKAVDMQTNKNTWYALPGNIYEARADWQSPPSGWTSIHVYPGYLYLLDYTFAAQTKHLTSQSTKTYDQLTNRYIYTNKKYTYNSSHNYPVAIEDTTSNGEKIVTTIKYAIDYDTSGSFTGTTFARNIKDLVKYNLPGTPIEKLQYRQYPDSSKKYLDGQLTNYYLNRPLDIYFLESHPPLTTVTPSTISSTTLSYDSHYRLAGNFLYTSEGMLQQQSRTKDVLKSYLWDYDSQYPVAEVTGANIQYGDSSTVMTIHGILYQSGVVTYTSFETDNKHGFTFSGSPQTESTSPTGKKCYDLSSGSISFYEDSSKVSVVSYWRNSTSSYTVTGSTSVKQGATHNGWTCFEHLVTGAGTVTISGSGLIDEVRVYPKGAQMTTYTYDPLIGVTSQCDAGNRIAYYEYDGLNRLKNVRDADENIVKNFKYNYGSDSSLTPSSTTFYYSPALQRAYNKNNCSFGEPDTVIYKAGYGKYASVISQTDANNKAIADTAANGQAYANAKGACYYYSIAEPVGIHEGLFWKDNCPYAKGPGNSLRYTVAARKYKSVVSQGAADSLALAEIDANGQAYANGNAGCSCELQSERYIADSCETGTRVNDETYQPHTGSLWTCLYHYEFSSGPNSEEFADSDVDPCPIY